MTSVDSPWSALGNHDGLCSQLKRYKNCIYPHKSGRDSLGAYENGLDRQRIMARAYENLRGPCATNENGLSNQSHKESIIEIRRPLGIKVGQAGRAQVILTWKQPWQPISMKSMIHIKHMKQLITAKHAERAAAVVFKNSLAPVGFPPSQPRCAWVNVCACM